MVKSGDIHTIPRTTHSNAVTILEVVTRIRNNYIHSCSRAKALHPIHRQHALIRKEDESSGYITKSSPLSTRRKKSFINKT